MSGKPVVAVVGPTASGKSDFALHLAVNLDSHCAILNADSMQLYRGLDIGTAKTPVAQRRGVPHLLFDVLEVHEEASVASYQKQARDVLSERRASGQQVIAVGGSGLYVRALLDRLDFPGTDPAVRARLVARAELEGTAAMYEELRRLDADAAAVIHPNNERRILRALEVISITGRPFSATLPKLEYHFTPTVQFALDWDLGDLDSRISTRTRHMFAGGIVEETQSLLAEGRKFGRTAARATGYAEALAVVAGNMTVEDAVEKVALATRQLARRQLKWFRRDPRIIWLQPGLASEQKALRIIEQAASGRPQRG